MGRKIPGKKHKGVKHPEKQQAVRFKSIKDKINAPPSNPDHQDVPKSLQRIIDFQERLKDGKVSLKYKRKKNKSKLITIDPVRKTEKPKTASNAKVNVKRLGTSKDPAPIFNQLPGESDKSFMVRVNEMVKTVLKESAFEDKYGVRVQRSSVTGEVEGVVKRPKDELDEMVKEAKRNEKQKMKKGKKKSDEPRLTKSQKKQMKLNMKKEKKAMLKTVDFDNYKDTIEFGDIVHEPPILSAPKKVAKLNNASRPGTKDLLLKSVLKENTPKPKIQFPISSKKSVFQKISGDSKIDKTAKRKDLPNANT
ncbi:uncharacterized protein CBL_13461 [Carabus blaptoides fortunei]